MSWLPATRYAWRTWPVAVSAAALMLGPGFVLVVGKDGDAPLRLRMVGLLLAAVVALVWEDRTAPVAAATPLGLPALQRARLLVLLAVVCVGWALTCVAASTVSADVRVWSATVEVGAVAALLTAIVGGLARERPGESLAAYPVPLLLVLLVLAFRVPERWALIATPDSPVWTDMHRRWAGLLVVGLLAVVAVGRDPAARPLRQVVRRTALPRPP